MLALPVATLNESLAQLTRDVDCVRDAADRASAKERADAACVALRAADALTAFAVQIIDRGEIEEATGLSPEVLLQLEAGRMGYEARTITNAAAQLGLMPNLSQAFVEGIVSWGQVRAILTSVARTKAEGRPEVDQMIGQQAPLLVDADPDHLVQLVDDLVARQRADLEVARENRAIDRSFLAIQNRLDGTGGSMYAEGDAESIATIAAALDASAEHPVNADQEGNPSRAQQRYDALVGICEAFLSGAPGGPSGGASGGSTRPRPRILATLDINDLTDPAKANATKLLWPLAGRPARLSSVARDMLLCDSIVVPVLFDRGQPVAVGDAAHTISPKVRTALIARDSGCRFPGCTAPASWTDAHHIIPGYGNQVNDLILLCRRCHRRLHRHNWRIKLHHDATITFTRRGRTYTSHPRLRSPPSARE